MKIRAQRLIHVKRLQVQASVGVLNHELNQTQPLVFDIELALAHTELKPSETDIHHVLDYRQVREIAQQEALRGHTYLVEALVDRVVQRLLELPNVATVRVAAFKPDAFADCFEVGVEVLVQRADLPLEAK
jgi:7,8-dihydroneopterin aldolase/epimerase/oxygenase